MNQAPDYLNVIAETTEDGVTERLFTLGDITGASWSAGDANGGRPLVLLGHGGGGHKKAPGVVGRARRCVLGCGFAAVAIDAPGFGDRPKTAQDEQFIAGIRAQATAGDPVGAQIARYTVALAAQAVPEWQATLDALGREGLDGPVGYWGVSLGGAIGVLLVAAEPRISAAVLGLVGHGSLAEAASRIRVPVEFLLQWDDELVPREEGLAMFGGLGSREKTLHANPGRHAEVPAFELESSERFLVRHLRPSPLTDDHRPVVPSLRR